MKKWVEELRCLWKNKWYVFCVSLTAVMGYGFLVTHQTVGIDDTPYAYYFEEGLAAIVGRWVFYLLNKIAHVAEFAPFLTDLAGVLLLMAASSVWCALFRRILGEKLPMWGSVLFSCLFLSNPLISEVFTYYLHNGVATGYLFAGISLCFFWEGLERWQGAEMSAEPAKHGEHGEHVTQGDAGKRRAGETSPWKGFLKKESLRCWCGSAVALWIAVGCYESFMIVYLVGICIVLCTARIRGKKGGFVPGAVRSLVLAAGIAAAGMVLRSLMIAGVTGVFGLEYLQDDAVQRSVTEMTDWMAEPEARGVFGMIVKRILVMYGVFAYAYYPIRIYVIAGAAAFLLCVVWSFRRRDAWILPLFLGSVIASYVLVVIEGKATYYRSAQFLPLFSAWGLLLIAVAANAASFDTAKLSVLRGLRRGKKEIHAGKEETHAGKEEICAGKKGSLAGKKGPLAEKEETHAGKKEPPAGKEEIRAGKKEPPAGKEEIYAGKKGLLAENKEISGGKGAVPGRERAVSGILRRVVCGIVCAGLGVVVWNQCTDLNKWFYIDWMKYENAVDTMNQVAYELERSFDVSKPVVFAGTYEPPGSIVQDAYVPYNSEIHYKMLWWTNLVDPHLLDKFYRNDGIWVAQTPALSVIDWGRRAFDTDQELIRFLEMHGHELRALQDASLYDEIELKAVGMPSFPQEGSIADWGDYIVVHF